MPPAVPLSPRLRLGPARLFALLLALQGGLNLAWAVFPGAHRWLLWEILPLTGELPARRSAVALGAGLLALSLGLARRKRYAWAASLVLHLSAALAHSANGPRWLPLLLAFFLAGALLAQRRVFSAHSRPGAARAGAWLVIIAAAVTWAGGMWIYPGGAIGSLRVLIMYLLFYDPLKGLNISVYTSALVNAAGGLAWLALWRRLERGLPPPDPAGLEARRQASTIVRAYGRTSMAHLTLLPDKHYFYSPGGSLVAYAVYGRVALALGDPIGPLGDAAGVIRAFREYCVQNDWLPAFCLTSTKYLHTYRQAGFGALCLGHEGVIDLAGFSLRGNIRKTLRKRYNRLSALGYRMQVCEPPISNTLLAELRKISDEWLGMARAAEKRFFLAWFDENLVRGERLAVVYAPDGMICAFTTLVPEYQLNEISIDLMRRRRGIESGVMDFLFVSLLFWARCQGYDTFNLGLSPLYGVGSPVGDSSGDGRSGGALETLIHFAYEHGNFYDFKGLNGFKLKFHPRWEPQFMIYPGRLALPWVGLAMARANAGEGESLWQYFSRRPPATLTEPGESYLAGSD